MKVHALRGTQSLDAITRYAVSPRSFPEALPPIEYGPGDTVRRVCDGGRITLKHREYRVGKAFRGYPVALRPTLCEGVLDVYFCTERIGWIDERTGRWGRATRGDETGKAGPEDTPPGCQASVRSAHSGPAAGGCVQRRKETIGCVTHVPERV